MSDVSIVSLKYIRESLNSFLDIDKKLLLIKYKDVNEQILLGQYQDLNLTTTIKKLNIQGSAGDHSCRN